MRALFRLFGRNTPIHLPKGKARCLLRIKSAQHSLRMRCASTVTLSKKNNVILMGSPGAGKTTVGRILGERLGLPVVDVDDHHLESYWGMSVADKLSKVGSDRFIEEEGLASLHFQRQGHIVSLTGSNPMYPAAMEQFANSGVVVFLDVKKEDIADRLEKMKVNRIVGQEDGTSMKEILNYRQTFYEKAYDIRVVCESNETQESIAEKIAEQIKDYKEYSGYVSTRDDTRSKTSTFSEAIFKGLAADGGLFVPNKTMPKFTSKQFSRMVDFSYQERALRILEKWIHPKDMHPRLLKSLINKAYNIESFDCPEIFPIRHFERNQYLLELFHGPTSSFKDAALQLMPQFFTDALKKTQESNTKYMVLVATSGDTGGAVLDGFARHAADSGVKVMVLFPEYGISEVQKRQMTSIRSENVHVVGVNGDFDDCQSFVKMAFQDPDLNAKLLGDNNFKLSAANSISWGRLVPQVVYHVSSYLDLVKNDIITIGDEIDLCIPTGNFGNILGAYYAKQMGIPIKRFICASNSNNVLTDFINTGDYNLQRRQLIKTTSPAIDILVSSNLERYIYHISDRDSGLVRSCYESLKQNGKFSVSSELLDKMRDSFSADWCSEEDCKKTIQDTLNRTGYLLDPHTAVAKTVGDRFNNANRPMIIASTAHCDKFAPEIMSFMIQSINAGDLTDLFKSLQAMRTLPPAHKLLENSLQNQRHHKTVIDSKYSDVVKQILSFSQLSRSV